MDAHYREGELVLAKHNGNDILAMRRRNEVTGDLDWTFVSSVRSDGIITTSSNPDDALIVTFTKPQEQENAA